MSESDPPVVLIVEDEPDVAETYKLWLQGDYEVRMGQNGDEGLELLDESVDVVLLDRRMPVVSGNEVLAAIEERDLQCRVAMVTAVDPDFDIVDMGCDDYVVKPVTRDRLLEVVEVLDERQQVCCGGHSDTLPSWDRRSRESTLTSWTARSGNSLAST